jgi:hypothetical protein
MFCAAVKVAPCVALKVKMVVSGAVCVNVPVTVPEVNGEVNVSGESIASVFVMFALAGVVV